MHVFLSVYCKNRTRTWILWVGWVTHTTSFTFMVSLTSTKLISWLKGFDDGYHIEMCLPARSGGCRTTQMMTLGDSMTHHSSGREEGWWWWSMALQQPILNPDKVLLTRPPFLSSVWWVVFVPFPLGPLWHTQARGHAAISLEW